MHAILLVEDDELLGKTMEEKLTISGFNVFWAKTGDDAITALKTRDIGLVYLDIMLPGELDGFEVLRTMKHNDLFKTIPVVILSNLGEFPYIERAMDIGATDYIVKITTSLEKLIQIANNHLTLRAFKELNDKRMASEE